MSSQVFIALQFYSNNETFQNFIENIF